MENLQLHLKGTFFLLPTQKDILKFKREAFSGIHPHSTKF